MSHTFDYPKESQRSKNFKKKWFSGNQFFDSSHSLEQTIASIKTLENNTIFSKELIIVYNTQDFTTLYISKNVEDVLGYSQDEYLGWKESAFFKIGAINQPDYHSNLLKWNSQFIDENPFKKSQTIGYGHVCGMSYQHKDGTPKQFLIRMKNRIEIDSKIPIYGVLFSEDISHLVKGKDYWMLFESFDDTKSFSKFYRKDGVDNYPITEREKEVLILIAAGKSTKEVANDLSISPETVGQHRKNMIKRTMAKDTSALIQLCKMCNII